MVHPKPVFSWKAVACKWSNTSSSCCLLTSHISRRITSRSHGRSRPDQALRSTKYLSECSTFTNIVLQNLCKIHSLFLASVSIQMTSHIFNFHFELLLGALLIPLEGKVLQEMSNGVVLRSLIARTSINPNSYSSSLATLDSL
jgi:hypothetical protein